ncbi:hypothetical protein BaRGS_00015574, partial [Batillaria attramentaria]
LRILRSLTADWHPFGGAMCTRHLSGMAMAIRLVLTTVYLAATVEAFSNGAPFSTCLTMFPKHGPTERQTGVTPFLISLSPTTYRPGTIVTVELTSTDGRPFRGLQVKATRSTGNTESVLGTFVQAPANKTKTFTCEGGYKNMVTHSNMDDVRTVTLSWKAPDNNVGDIVFTATFVENFTVFWTGITSQLHPAPGYTLVPSDIIVSTGHFQTVVVCQEFLGVQTSVSELFPSLTTFPTGLFPSCFLVSRPIQQLPGVEEQADDVDLSTCGSTKGCFLYPRYCSGSNCKAAATYWEDGDYFRFELTAEDSTYVSIGFSDDVLMRTLFTWRLADTSCSMAGQGEDETVICTAYDQVTSVQHGFNPSRHNVRTVRDQLSDLKVRLADGRITCSFRRPRVAVTRAVNQSASQYELIIKTYDLHDEYYLMLAWGTVKLGTDVANKHKELPPVTDGKVSLRQFQIHRGSILPVEARIHGSLMVVAWVVFAGLTTAMSRYFKPWLGKRLFSGSNMWFQVHRVTGIITGVITIASVILIFIVVGGFAEKEKKHAIVGLTLASLVVVQVMAGLLRPGKGADARFFFNWGHRILGQCVHILSAVTMYLAFDIRYIPNVMQDFGVAVLTGWVALQIVWTIAFELRRCCAKENCKNDGWN